MHGSAEREGRVPGPPGTVLTGAVADALRAVTGLAGGVYLCSGAPGELRLSVLAGLPGQLFRPWWRLTVDRPFPAADAFRTRAPVVLADPAETMRRYPQLAAGLPFRFGSLYVPVLDGERTYGVLTVLRAGTSPLAEAMPARDRLGPIADALGAALGALEREGARVVWDGEPLCVRPPVAGRPPRGRAGRFTWDPAADELTVDATLRALAGPGARGGLRSARDLAEALAPDDGHLVLAALMEAASGPVPPGLLRLRSAEGGRRLLELRPHGEYRGEPHEPAHGESRGKSRGNPHGSAHGESRGEPHVHAPPWEGPAGPGAPAGSLIHGLVVDPEPGPPADGAADLLPDGVFAFDRLGLLTYVNPRAARLLGRPRETLLGRQLWEAVPWLDRPVYEDHIRASLLSEEPVHFQVSRPRPDAPGPVARAEGGRAEGDWLTLSLYPGPDLVTCRIVPLGQVAETAEGAPADAPAPGTVPTVAPTAGPSASGLPPAVVSTAPLYRPIVLAIALSEALTARQVSEVVMRELLPAFGGGRLAIYLLHEDRHLYLAWEHGFPSGFLRPFEGVALDARLPGVETLTSGRPLFFESMHKLAALYPGIPLDATEGARAFLPLIASGRPVGSCILGFDRERGFSDEERTVLTALAGLIAQALERARRYESEAALARGLQEALLPHRLSAHPRVETAGCYLPGTQGMDVGGDWYDVVDAGEGLALVIGDVQGHGVQAAATMGQLRSAVRAFALGDHPPGEVMSSTNRLLIDLDPGQFASCCYIRLDPLTGLARAARAGHPQPLLRHPDGRTDVLDLPGGVVLGVAPEAEYPVTELRLEPGAVLALYTDGLVERAGHDIDEGIGALRTALTLAGGRGASAQPPSLPGVAGLLTDRARRAADRPDDIALLLTRLRPYS
ncbi:SpoIIE family protein phosphatase [Streptomyces sp. PG2]